jgi:hypothetical protein
MMQNLLSKNKSTFVQIISFSIVIFATVYITYIYAQKNSNNQSDDSRNIPKISDNKIENTQLEEQNKAQEDVSLKIANIEQKLKELDTQRQDLTDQLDEAKKKLFIITRAKKQEKAENQAFEIAQNIDMDGLNPEVLNKALLAYKKADQKGLVTNQKLTIIDYSLPSDTKRLWVIDMETKKTLFNIRVAHGVNSGERLSEKFSNIEHSKQSSIGVMKTGGTYYGKHGLSLNLHGLDFTNSNVYSRRVVIHSAKYVTEDKASKTGMIGRSWGCPAVDVKYSSKLIKTIVNGSILFSYYPNASWLEKSTWLNA